ncbi:hypothetical protein Psi02_37230 [Planotetraspora silvatica]|uniref:Uncharacterized protein n=1 Tax=Planotetraspora silvatica TaxID=234614 RepID=A0A8J3XNA3_9ACTN|nr:hypothetical protein [Planotetraspora silvatica]GII47299.1 hypothetical protein Psi02_37230 [Planotetraspora silvatica]
MADAPVPGVGIAIRKRGRDVAKVRSRIGGTPTGRALDLVDEPVVDALEPNLSLGKE